jgi:pilus assembly protein Flp/PilA
VNKAASGPRIKRSILALRKCKRGGTAIEYGLILALVALAAFTAIGTTANRTVNMWKNVSNTVTNN